MGRTATWAHEILPAGRLLLHSVDMLVDLVEQSGQRIS